jgi:hypothetical protein
VLSLYKIWLWHIEPNFKNHARHVIWTDCTREIKCTWRRLFLPPQKKRSTKLLVSNSPRVLKCKSWSRRVQSPATERRNCIIATDKCRIRTTASTCNRHYLDSISSYTPLCYLLSKYTSTVHANPLDSLSAARCSVRFSIQFFASATLTARRLLCNSHYCSPHCTRREWKSSARVCVIV